MEQIDRYWIGQIARMKRTCTEEEVKRWGILTKDCNDVYQSGFSSDLNQPMVSGIISEGLITEVIRNKLPGTACVIMQKELVFLQPVQIGNTITAEIEIIDLNIQRNLITEKVRCMNEHGLEVIRGQVVLKLL